MLSECLPFGLHCFVSFLLQDNRKGMTDNEFSKSKIDESRRTFRDRYIRLRCHFQRRREPVVYTNVNQISNLMIDDLLLISSNSPIIILSPNVWLWLTYLNWQMSLVNQRNGRHHVCKVIADLIGGFGLLADCDWIIKNEDYGEIWDDN